MAATRTDIKHWFGQGVKQKATHMVVVCDTFDFEDYPIFVMPGEDVHEIAEKHDGPNMTKLMEVYSFSLDMETQLREERAFHYE